MYNTIDIINATCYVQCVCVCVQHVRTHLYIYNIQFNVLLTVDPNTFLSESKPLYLLVIFFRSLSLCVYVYFLFLFFNSFLKRKNQFSVCVCWQADWPACIEHVQFDILIIFCSTAILLKCVNSEHVSVCVCHHTYTIICIQMTLNVLHLHTSAYTYSFVRIYATIATYSFSTEKEKRRQADTDTERE